MRAGRFFPIALIALSLLLSACGSPAPQEVAIRPIEDILASGPEFVAVGPDTATLLAETTVPVVCAVVYGPTSAYGQMATDMDMAGGGHTDHQPTLTGLQPDTEYLARLQGVGPDGTLYRSEEYTFRSAPAAAEQGPPNLALPANGARVLGASSTFGGAGSSQWGPANAFDGSGGTAWSSAGDGDDAWIELELAAETRVTRVGFWTRTMGSSAEIQSFQIVTGSGETLGPFTLSGAAEPAYFDTDFTASRLRFEAVTSSGGNTGAVEIEVYGEPVP